MSKNSEEVFTIKVKVDGVFKFLKKGNLVSTFTSRKSIRNFITNQVRGEFLLYRNGKLVDHETTQTHKSLIQSSSPR